MQKVFFGTGTNNARSITQKIEMIQLICFLTQRMHKKDPDKYPNCMSVLEAIFDINLKAVFDVNDYNGVNVECVRAFGLICDDLIEGMDEELPKPEGVTNAKEIKDKIVNYFKEEWMPF